jgi:hypothetical protein
MSFCDWTSGWLCSSHNDRLPLSSQKVIVCRLLELFLQRGVLQLGSTSVVRYTLLRLLYGTLVSFIWIRTDVLAWHILKIKYLSFRFWKFQHDILFIQYRKIQIVVWNLSIFHLRVKWSLCDSFQDHDAEVWVECVISRMINMKAALASIDLFWCFQTF